MRVRSRRQREISFFNRTLKLRHGFRAVLSFGAGIAFSPAVKEVFEMTPKRVLQKPAKEVASPLIFER